jgi:serine/threonine protein kinase
MGLVATLEPGDPREIGPYRLLGKLGSGGMGQVFLGMSAGGRPIAVKVIRDDLADDPEFRRRFRREVGAARKVSGLFTAQVIDAELDGSRPWLATVYVAGPSLTEAVRSHGPLPVRTLLALAAGLAESLSAIHAAGVVHRDLKPSNVLLAEDGPRVIDFGISEAAETSGLTGADMVIGSPGFMSPEQVLGLDIGPASDMFSLGAVLAFAGTGQGPFGSGSNAALVYRLVNSPASLARLPVELRPLVGGCLAKHPSDRPTADELLAVVGAIQPARGWLSESIIYGSAASQSAAELLGTATEATAVPAGNAGPVATVGPAAALVARSAEPGSPGNPGRHARRRLTRPLASAGITCGLVVASAAAVIALTGAVRQPPAQPNHSRAVATVTVPGTSSSAPVTPSPSSSAPGAVTAPNAFVNPALSQSLTPSASPSASGTSPASDNSPGASASPSASASSSSSPSSSPSASPSASASASPSPSDSPSASPSPSPSSSPSPTQSASPSPSPSDSPSASASASATPSATSS